MVTIIDSLHELPTRSGSIYQVFASLRDATVDCREPVEPSNEPAGYLGNFDVVYCQVAMMLYWDVSSTARANDKHVES